jgi:hypothetical protein
MNAHIHKAGAAAWAAVLLLAMAGCGGGGGGSGGSSNPSSPPPPVGGTNQPPTISGTATTSVTSGQAYSFQPTASDPDNQTLTFSIASKPAWANFSTTTGRLSGTPTTTGTFSNIVISVTDGIATASLSAFTITVQAAAATGSAKLSWVPPTTNEDGSPLTNLAGYLVRYGKTVGALNQIVDVGNAGATTVTIGSLSTGTWYFTLASYTNVGVESVQTAPVSKTIG